MNIIYKVIISCFLGMVEGLTEFLPISSTGHLVLIENLLNNVDEFCKIFTVVIQLGAILAVVVVFRNRLYNTYFVCIKKLFIRQHCSKKHLCIQHIFLGMFPSILLGFVFYERIGLIFNLQCVVYGLVIGSIFLLIGELLLHKTQCTSNVDDITYLQAFLIGCFQCLSFWPGFSRSGATIGGGLLVGLNRHTSSEFSFFLAVPTIFAAVVLILYYHESCIKITDYLLLLVGSLVSFFFAIFTIKFFLKIVQKFSLIPFIIYRFLLAGGIYCMLV